MKPGTNPPRRDSVSIALLIIALLILLPAGLCSVYVGVSEPLDDAVAFVAIVWGLPIVVAAGLVYVALRRNQHRRTAERGSSRNLTGGTVALLILGLLIAIPSGLCTTFFGASLLFG